MTTGTAKDTTKRRFDAMIFDLDGVLTDTASLHFSAWKKTFDEYLESTVGAGDGKEFTEQDYREYVDGKPRYDGVESFLDSRGISLPYGAPGDSPDQETICGLGNSKNEYYHRLLEDEGVELFDSTKPLLRRLEEEGIAKAVVSSSKNARRVLEAAGIKDRFDAIVDGTDLAELDLPGKPDPALFLEAARRVGVDPDRAVVVEDATAGVRAGRGGGFGLVVGVDRDGAAGALKSAGAEVVVRDLLDIPLRSGAEAEGREDEDVAAGQDSGESEDGPGEGSLEGKDAPTIRDLPMALDRVEEIRDAMAGRESALFLDYDGTLAPIVDDPSAARLPGDTREALGKLSSLCTVSVVSGRDRYDVEQLVDLPGVYYAGSHGFDVRGPEGMHEERGKEYLPALDEAERRLEDLPEVFQGVHLERKRYALAVHFRTAKEDAETRVRSRVQEVARQIPELRMTGGKKIFELRPALKWDKGTTVLHLLEVLGLDGDEVFSLYVGDDLTDEDAFRALPSGGMGVVVKGERDNRPTAARYALRDPDEVCEFLRFLVEVLERSER